MHPLTPGETALTATPSSRRAAASATVSPSRPCLAAERCTRSGSPARALRPRMLTMRPPGMRARQSVSDASERPVEGDRADLMPVLLGDRLDALSGTIGRVVDEDPQPAVCGDGIEHALHRRWIGDVGGDREGAPTVGADGGDHRVGLLGVGPGVDGHRKPVCRKAFGDDRSQTAARAGHQGDVGSGVSHRQSARSVASSSETSARSSRRQQVASRRSVRSAPSTGSTSSRNFASSSSSSSGAEGVPRFPRTWTASDRPEASVISTSASCLPRAGSVTTFTRSRRSTTSGRVRIACDSSSVPTRRKIAAAAAQWRRLNFACMGVVGCG